MDSLKNLRKHQKQKKSIAESRGKSGVWCTSAGIWYYSDNDRCKSAAEYDTKRFISQNRNYTGRYKPNWEWNAKFQFKHGKKTRPGIGDAAKTWIYSKACQKIVSENGRWNGDACQGCFDELIYKSIKLFNNGEVPLPIKFFLKTYTKNLTNPNHQCRICFPTLLLLIPVHLPVFQSHVLSLCISRS